MNVITILDIISTIGFSAAFVIVCRLGKNLLEPSCKLFLCLPLVVYILVGLSNCLEHGNITAYFDSYEDYFELLFTPFFLFFIFSFKIHCEVDERKQAEEDLRKSKNFLQSIIDGFPESLMVINPDYSIALANRSVRESIREKEQAVNCLNCYQINHNLNTPCDEAEYPCPVRQVLATKAPARVTHTHHYKKDGNEIIVDVIAVPLLDDAGNVIQIIQSSRDITERKQAEEERIRLSTAVEQADEAMTIVGSDGIIQYVNPVSEQLMGYSRDELIGKNMLDFERSSDQQQRYKEIWEAINRGSVWGGHVTEKKKDGSNCKLYVTVSPVRDQSGKITSFVSIGRDITKETELEEQLRQSQKMEAIGTLAGGIAHDFNNILAAIIGYTELSLADSLDGKTVRSNLEQILQSSMRARDLVKQILAFSRRSGHERKSLELHSVIKEAVKLLRASIPTTIDIRLDTNVQDATVMADPTQIHQVIMNLGTNAADAMQENGGVLEMKLSQVALNAETVKAFHDLQPGTYVKLAVRDTGPGIDPSVVDRIFEPFFTTKKIDRGTGMGLAVVYGIVKSHGGDITVESEAGKGSTFHVLLPKAENAIKEKKAGVKSLPTGNEHILFVDDEDVLVDVGKKILESLGYNVIAEKRSAEALETFRNDPDKFDIVITDQTMPDMTGYDLAKELIRIKPDVPIVLCTGFSENVSSEKAKAVGIKEFLMKPINRKNMAETIRKVLDDK